jgi:uncharacterized protein YndB with AHSA1/START domain
LNSGRPLLAFSGPRLHEVPMSTQNGYFLIADITGYTQYLSESELDHAQQILTNLLNLLIRHTRPPLIISRLAGDAVISYGLSDSFLQGQTFAEMLEDTYVSFRRTVELMVRNTTCSCNACRNIQSLDLKFFVHYGEFGVQKLDAHDELVGSDVNLLHRLLKNHVTEETGMRAYTLFTDAAIQKLGLGDALPALLRHEESYEHLGTVLTWVEDMHPVWEAKRLSVQVRVTPEQELMRVSTEIALPPERVWDLMLQPAHFNVLTGGQRIEIEQRSKGRVGVGSVYQCYHGDGTVLPQTILTWQPFERVVIQFEVPMPIRGISMTMELRLEPTPEGVRFSEIYAKSSGPYLGRLMADAMVRKMRGKFREDVARFRAHAEGLDAARPPLAPPALPESAVSAAALSSLSPAPATAASHTAH